ncbi:MAG: DUF711 family protein, partial [Chloroflexi bacterium]|nr:DUF711 family protein [Chloroflexota bacterium]
MKIRAVTVGLDLPVPHVTTSVFDEVASFLRDATQAFSQAGLEVQTTRIAGADLGQTIDALGDGLKPWAAETEHATREAGIDYLSIGRIPARQHAIVRDVVAPLLSAGTVVNVSADLLEGGLPSIAMAAACATAVKHLAHSTDQGFGNLRFAATASCPPNIPFLPAAYHVGGAPRFAIAVQAADVAVAALSGTGGMSDIEDRLVDAFETAVEPLEASALQLEAESGYPFVGVDLSPAPFPSDDAAIGAAIEAAGVERFGAPGSLYVAAMLTRAIRRTRIRRSGFSGLMLPVLEDSVLARRMGECPSRVHELLLYSAVCGTGLDTVPLAEDISESELAGIYLDVA